jgi:hypothetical protein
MLGGGLYVGGVFTAGGAPGSTVIDGGTLDALGGGVIHLLADTSLTFAGGATQITADGGGSVLDLHTVTGISVGAGVSSVSVDAYNGGRVDLGGTTTVRSVGQAGSLYVSAQGLGSLIDLTALTSFTAAAHTGRVDTRSGGTIQAPALTALDGIDLEPDRPGGIPTAQITTLTNGGLGFGSGFDFRGLTNGSGTDFAVGGQGVVTLPNLANADGAGFRVSGATLAVPALTRYSGIPGRGAAFRVEGPGSVLDLHNLTSITTPAGSGLSMYFPPYGPGAQIILSPGGTFTCSIEFDAAGTLSGGTFRLTEGNALYVGMGLSGVVGTLSGNLVVSGGNAYVLADGTLVVTGSDTQTAGGTVFGNAFNGNTLTVGGLFDLQGGTCLVGYNTTINGNVRNAITLDVAPLTIYGDYTQTATGTLNVYIGGTGQYAPLIVTGRATLDGTLAVQLVGGYVPQPGDQIQVLLFGSGSSGTFAHYTGDGGGFSFLYVYEDGNPDFPAGLTLVAN